MFFVLCNVLAEIRTFSQKDFSHAFERLGLDGRQDNLKAIENGFVIAEDLTCHLRRPPTEDELAFMLGRKAVPFYDALMWAFHNSRRKTVQIVTQKLDTADTPRPKVTIVMSQASVDEDSDALDHDDDSEPDSEESDEETPENSPAKKIRTGAGPSGSGGQK